MGDRTENPERDLLARVDPEAPDARMGFRRRYRNLSAALGLALSRTLASGAAETVRDVWLRPSRYSRPLS